MESARNRLFYGDNLDVLRDRQVFPDGSVDLVYLDPPFNSNRDYSVIFNRRDVHVDVSAQIQAFTDTWTWTAQTEQHYSEYVGSGYGGLPVEVADALTAIRTLLGENDATAYLVNMAPRLVELHRVLKSTGTLWLHCDPTMSHYLRVLLDAIFDPSLFRNEVIWQRSPSKSLQTRRLPTNHDALLAYGKGLAPTWSDDASFAPYVEKELDAKTSSKYSHRDPDGRLYQLTSLINPAPDRPNLTYEFLGVTKVWRWTKERMQEAYDAGLVVQTAPGRVPRFKRYLDEQRGRSLGDVWTDIPPINSQAAERLGYPTQKPVALLERIIALASHPGDVVLDPFAGCGTAIDAAQKLGRHWTGIDITYIAIDLIEKRLEGAFGPAIREQYVVAGIPRDPAAAQRLFDRNPFDFERWAVSMLDAQPHERARQQGDKGIDGVARFLLTTGTYGRIVVSVKGGQTLSPSMVRDLSGTVEHAKAELGVLITQHEPTKGMVDAANHGGTWTHPHTGQTYPKVQLVTTSDLLAGRLPLLPPRVLPYIQAQRTTAGRMWDAEAGRHRPTVQGALDE